MYSSCLYKKNDIQFLSVSAELGFGVGELHGEMLLLLFGQPRRIQDRSSVNHRNVSRALPLFGNAHAQVPAHLLGLLARQVVPLLGQIHDHLENASVRSSENITKKYSSNCPPAVGALIYLRGFVSLVNELP